ncbi:MAG: nicotinate (nicotinamide) nucleotide adenylyltransferase [Zetaproteobacteria bacterium CG06_land_8_20_14_3_00_59_53]|nr:MAG: nicotinate (nicotinamide) nucleotide adenylyltransferase [Zetaproteobacteria bacterium CG23_combo_of_CG06-09_8_20_14_all_59_86]PIQ64595.1 MAG: nicotinate (nicotinamide) nucleotide adenylyltransferase [Zetaproteobacteria bacterium CG11_big_fil_rev_8_21_14_0_20_59_439]PIU71295.1 MAG: nicotinate (nicotinamide) nucleotide adenylyltransferase [Zetaproteobacteria bacterium CG06_land_8_20_14_3_00_59_53]PIU97230.1 MAG: nicotinate (nicotinamide) nucleotide adenylyltransferase [Zetaproteobacteria 
MARFGVDRYLPRGGVAAVLECSRTAGTHRCCAHRALPRNKYRPTGCSRNQGRLTRSVKRIGLFGGSFDPPHIGHVALVHAALAGLRLDEVWVIPAGLPVHRTLSDRATPADRLDWMRRIFAGDRRVRVMDWEVAADTPTPTIVTLRRFAAACPEVHGVLLLGADAFAGMDGWVDYPEHAGQCDVAVFGRAAHQPAGDAAAAFGSMSLQAWLNGSAGCGRRVDMDVALPEVSATGVRRMAEHGENLAGMVPECVRREIEQAYAGPAA